MLLSPAIAGMFVRIPIEQHQFADAVCCLLTCSLPGEMEKYLSRKGILWKPPSTISEAEVTYLDDEYSNFVTDSQPEPGIADTMLDDEANRDYQVVQDKIKSSITNRLSISHMTSNTNFNLDSKESDDNLIKLSSRAITLPPIDSVTPVPLKPLDSWSPKETNSSGAGRKGSWAPSTSVNEERHRQVRRPAQDIIFRQELKLIKSLRYPGSRVVWLPQKNPPPPHHILSI